MSFYLNQNQLPSKEALTTVNCHQQTSPSLAELQSLLLACRTLTALEELKQHHTSARVKQAYQALSFEQQLPLDGLEASAVPQEVFKYVGDIQSNSDGFAIKTGMLVYLDPQSQHTDTTAFVWALPGSQQGQRSPVSVERDQLVQVEKLSPLKEPGSWA